MYLNHAIHVGIEPTQACQSRIQVQMYNYDLHAQFQATVCTCMLYRHRNKGLTLLDPFVHRSLCQQEPWQLPVSDAQKVYAML